MASLLPDNDIVVVHSSDFEHDDAKEVKMVSNREYIFFARFIFGVVCCRYAQSKHPGAHSHVSTGSKIPIKEQILSCN